MFCIRRRWRWLCASLLRKDCCILISQGRPVAVDEWPIFYGKTFTLCYVNECVCTMSDVQVSGSLQTLDGVVCIYISPWVFSMVMLHFIPITHQATLFRHRLRALNCSTETPRIDFVALMFNLCSNFDCGRMKLYRIYVITQGIRHSDIV